MHPFFDRLRPHLFGHRGASAEAPENTLPAFARALAHGVPYLETDCHATRDGELVLLHDAELARTTDGDGVVSALSYAELQRLDAGYAFTPDGGRTFPFRGCGVRVPRLIELLEAFPAARINLELKQESPAIADELVRLVRRAGAASRMLLAAAEEPVLASLRALEPGTALGSSVEDVVLFAKAIAAGDAAFRPRGHALQIPPDAFGQPLVTSELIAGAHRLGLFVHVWTIGEPAEMKRLLALGVDGIMSDYPDRLVAAALG